MALLSSLSAPAALSPRAVVVAVAAAVPAEGGPAAVALAAAVLA
ncbi:hypothetical protein [Methylobacterium sp. J-077]|nr:hypothetical protein [Methylobacterium sp. J-077]